jgi:hypothetical protein
MVTSTLHMYEYGAHRILHTLHQTARAPGRARERRAGMARARMRGWWLGGKVRLGQLQQQRSQARASESDQDPRSARLLDAATWLWRQGEAPLFPPRSLYPAKRPPLVAAYRSGPASVFLASNARHHGFPIDISGDGGAAYSHTAVGGARVKEFSCARGQRDIRISNDRSYILASPKPAYASHCASLYIPQAPRPMRGRERGVTWVYYGNQNVLQQTNKQTDPSKDEKRGDTHKTVE